MSASKNRQLPLLDRVVWITGASSGIGEALSYRCSELGAKLILTARREEALQRVNDRLPRLPGTACVLPQDLERLAELPQLTERALTCFGRIDVFISNAGLAVKDYAVDTRLDIDQKLMNVNYFAPTVLTKHLLPHFLERGAGQIAVVSSLSGKYGVPRIAAYAASKHALHGFFETLRSEVHDTGVDITIIVPGIIRTEITAHAVTGTGESFGRVEKTFRAGYPVDKAARDIVRAILARKEEVFVGGTERITLWLQRLSPWLLRRFIRNHPIKRLRRLKRRLSFWERSDPY
jgi:dehydrogenase/reductase SDR family protein 7B